MSVKAAPSKSPNKPSEGGAPKPKMFHEHLPEVRDDLWRSGARTIGAQLPVPITQGLLVIIDDLAQNFVKGLAYLGPARNLETCTMELSESPQACLVSQFPRLSVGGFFHSRSPTLGGENMMEGSPSGRFLLQSFQKRTCNGIAK